MEVYVEEITLEPRESSISGELGQKLVGLEVGRQVGYDWFVIQPTSSGCVSEKIPRQAGGGLRRGTRLISFSAAGGGVANQVIKGGRKR